MFNAMLMSAFLANATSNVDVLSLADRGLSGSYVSNPTNSDQYMLADPAGCTFTLVENTRYPSQTDSCSTEGAGSVIWNIAAFCADRDDWSMFCHPSTLQWTKNLNNKPMSSWTSEGKPIVRFNVDNTRDGSTENPTAWAGSAGGGNEGDVTGMAAVGWKCDEAVPTGWQWGGALHICLTPMTTATTYSAVICNQGDSAYDTPDCANMVPIVETGGMTSDPACPFNPNPTPFSSLDD